MVNRQRPPASPPQHDRPVVRRGTGLVPEARSHQHSTAGGLPSRVDERACDGSCPGFQHRGIGAVDGPTVGQRMHEASARDHFGPETDVGRLRATGDEFSALVFDISTVVLQLPRVVQKGV
jgi:hypothetical protein